MQRIFSFILFFLVAHTCMGQQQYELSSGWKCMKASDVHMSGEALSIADSPLAGWMPATVPGTVLTTLLNNHKIPDPFYGMNNEHIPDIYTTGRAYYTYWFVNDFKEAPPVKGSKVYIDFRGVNYSFDIYVNGHKLDDKPDAGMFCSSSYDIGQYLNASGNRLAVIVYPPDPVGKPNGGQGGDGMIARNITNQFVAGWDWIQPIRDRNTGIWDKVLIRKTGAAHIEHTHVVTLVPGRRSTTGKQQPAYIRVTTEAENTSGDDTIKATVQYALAGKKVSTNVKLAPNTIEEVSLPELQLDDPKLWWPNGYGEQNIYPLNISLLINGKTVADEEHINVGVRQIKTTWNTRTSSRQILVNGQKIFIKGGNWILTDAMLRLSKERYDNEVRMHRDMNLNLLRVWGGGITERPEFYDACDKYGLLVMQDFWVSGDCNGRWDDPLKAEDTNARRKYPDDHALFISSLEDQIKLLRNHPSLALWCGGNEIRPPQDVLTALKDTLLPELDNTRFFFEFSNDDSMSLHGGDGPYVLQDDKYFWQHRSFPFNSEIGSVGIGDAESLERIMPKENMVVPYYSTEQKKWIVDSLWRYHRYEGYDSVIEAYGHAANIEDFTKKAQLVNYNQYRALIEGASAHMWDWYTGIIIWKTQNPWTAMKGQMYDCYLDPNACLYATAEASKPVHVMYDPIHKTAMAVNNLFKPTEKMELVAKAYTMRGDEMPITSKYIQVPASKSITGYSFGKAVDSLASSEGVFLYLSLTDSATNTVTDENIYWLPDGRGLYSGLSHMPKANVTVTAKATDNQTIEVTIANPIGAPVAFFSRVSLVDPVSKKRVLPVFYSDNYISVLPGQEQTIKLEYNAELNPIPMVCIDGINVTRQYVTVENSKSQIPNSK